jgi:hypothetical protein
MHGGAPRSATKHLQTRFGDSADEYHKYVHSRNIASQMMLRHHNMELLQYRSLQQCSGACWTAEYSTQPQQVWVLMVLGTPGEQHLRTTESTRRQNKRQICPHGIYCSPYGAVQRAR